MGDANPGCADYRCCYDETDGGIAACYHWSEVVGYSYKGEMDPVHHPECFTGITRDGTDADQTNCRNCSHGCHSFKDRESDLFGYALWTDGVSYLRSVDGARHGRDAQNRIFDLLTNHPTLIQYQCRVEHGSCYENNPYQFGGYVCWGHHVCQCTPGPTWTPVGDCDNFQGGGYPVDGLMPDEFFFNFQGWPPTHGVDPGSELFCRQWNPADGGSSPRNAPINIHRHGGGPVYNASFIRSREGLSPDVLVPCAGWIAPAPDCINPTTGDCTYDDIRPVSTRINETPSSQQKFDDLRIDLATFDIRLRSEGMPLSAQQLREHQLFEDVFNVAIVGDGGGQVYPDEEGALTMDRVAMPIAANQYIGHYVREFNGPDWEEADLLRVIEFPHCRTRWGNVPVVAHMVIVSCLIRVYLTVPHFAKGPLYGSGQSATHWIKPYATVEIQIETAMRCDSVTTGITVGGEPVVVTNPAWGSGPGGGYAGIPTVTPAGNEIIYARDLDGAGKPLPVRVPRKWRWFGRLGSFSDPMTTQTDFEASDRNCEDLIDVIGTFTVPALATANESEPTDPNRNYAGSIAFAFSHEV